MSQHDMDISNQSRTNFRTDLNNALLALISNSSGATEPATMFAYQFWADTTTGLLKIRNAANSAWVTVGTMASAYLGLLPLSGGTLTGLLTVNGQIKFPATQNASADPNTLDDYEEGTWTPGISFGGGTTGITYSKQNGNYTKIGNLVICPFEVVMTSKGSSTGAVRITGLPYTSKTSASLVERLDISSWSGMATAFYKLNTIMNANATTAQIAGVTVAATTSVADVLTDADFTNSGGIYGTIIYLVP
jgi:hypothetical protein